MTEGNLPLSQDAVKEVEQEATVTENTQEGTTPNITAVPFIVSATPVDEGQATPEDSPESDVHSLEQGRTDDVTPVAEVIGDDAGSLHEEKDLDAPESNEEMTDTTDNADATDTSEDIADSETITNTDDEPADLGEDTASTDADDADLGEETPSDGTDEKDDSFSDGATDDADGNDLGGVDEDTTEASHIGVDQNKVAVALKALRAMDENLKNVIALLESEAGTVTAQEAAEAVRDVAHQFPKVDSRAYAGTADGGRVVEGVFNGNNMVGSDGKIYTVPPNYASKSKLVEGDMLKLTITPKGTFIYKQIGPIERSRVIGTLGYDDTSGEWYATTDNRRWSVIKASVTYFKGDAGDEIVLLVPMNAPSRWAAVENIIKKDTLV